jgi:uncharacterized membrane protein YccC
MQTGAHVIGIRPATGWASTPWRPVWSTPAALRAVRAALVIPVLFALTFKVIGNLQMASFAAFGSFATLILVTFAGTPKDKLAAHLGLAVAGSALLVVGTLVSFSTPVAALATLVVVFAVFFAAILGPNAASGITGALLAYVLPAASAGGPTTIPDRLAGWWLASIAGTAAVLIIRTPSSADRLRASVKRLSSELADTLEAMVRGDAADGHVRRCAESKSALLSVFNATPFRPTGLATRDRALAEAVELLEWCTVAHRRYRGAGIRCSSGGSDGSRTPRELRSGAPLRRRALAGDDAVPDIDALTGAQQRAAARTGSSPSSEARTRLAFRCQAIAAATLAIAHDAQAGSSLKRFQERLTGLARVARAVTDQADARSVLLVNSARGALALATAVAVADLSGVQHGFWVVLGTLSVLRTNAAATGSTALRALLGTAIGFAIGATLMLAIGSNSTALWVALPLAVMVAAYAPGAAPFAVGQAAFTITIIVLFNLLDPVGWKVGELRLLDVAIGCAVSLTTGLLLWPRGASALVGDDLGDAYRTGSLHLRQAVEWVCGQRVEPPDAGERATAAGARLDVALRTFLAEQGAKRLAKDDLWRLVGGTLRLRLTARAVTKLPHDSAPAGAELRDTLAHTAAALEQFCDQLAGLLGPPDSSIVPSLEPPALSDPAVGGAKTPELIWLSDNLDTVTGRLSEVIAPAERLAAIRRQPWWR